MQFADIGANYGGGAGILDFSDQTYDLTKEQYLVTGVFNNPATDSRSACHAVRRRK